MKVRNHTYSATQHGKCNTMAGASKGGEYQDWMTGHMMGRPTTKPAKGSNPSASHMQNLYGGKNPEGKGK